MHRSRLLFAPLILIVLACLLSGCGGSSKPSISFMYWGDIAYNKAALDRALAQFRKDHKGLDVTEAYTPYGSAYYEKLIVMFGAQSSPDVFFISNPNFTAYAQHGGLQDLTTRVAKAPQLPLDKGKLASFTLGGKVYAVPKGGVGYAISKQSTHVDAAWDLIKDLITAGYPTR